MDVCLFCHTISTHTLTWSVTLPPAPDMVLGAYFNSHAHVERDARRTKSERGLHDFNSHAHVERDEPVAFQPLDTLHFNSHAHVERDTSLPVDNRVWIDFNSHAHVERDISRLDVAYDDFISTHTLTWSVTNYTNFLGVLRYISTHTLTWSVTRL